MLGQSGQIGWELARTLAPLGLLTIPDSRRLDLGNPADIRRWIADCRPQIIVNAAAYTAVDKAETDQETALAVNGVAPGILGEEARKIGSLVIHFSTDYVFDGGKQAPYTELDPVNPINVYGKTKLAGEQALQASGAPHIIFRTSWVYGLRGRNFLGTILRLAAEGRPLTIVNDQTGTPTWCRMAAEATALVIAQKGLALADVQGIYNLTCQGETTWYEFARQILLLQPDPRLKESDVGPITSDQYITPARRPGCSVLDNAKMENTFGVSLPHWLEALKLVFG